MSKLNINPLFIIAACLCHFTAASYVCASDLNDNHMTNIVDADSDDVAVISVSPVNEEELSESENAGTFEELNNDMETLTDKSVYYFDKDYAFDEKIDMS